MREGSVALSVVIPVYGCAGCLEELLGRVHAATTSVTSDYEIVLVDDRSPDGAWQRIAQLADADSRLRAIRLSRNFGQHAAITAGLAECRGRRVVVMDCDLEDPPERIPDLWAKADEGNAIVFARRIGRTHSPFRRLAARAYFHALNVFTKSALDGSYGTFSIIDRRVADSYLEVGDRSRHYLLILNWLGYRRASIDVEHGQRRAGRSSYTFGALIRHAVDGLFFQTTVLLRWIVYAGFVVALTGIALAIFFLYSYLTANPYPGWTSLAVLLLLIGGFIIVSTGVAGLYVGQIFDQVKDRPLYVVDERLDGREP